MVCQGESYKAGLVVELSVVGSLPPEMADFPPEEYRLDSLSIA
jgi:hypothetical protein